MLAVLFILLLGAPAWAQDSAQGPAWLSPVRALFELDVWFWDNELPPGQSTGAMLGQDEVLADDGSGRLQLARRYEAMVDQAQVDIGEGMTLSLGQLTLDLSRDAEARLVGEVRGGPVDLSQATSREPMGPAHGQPGAVPAGPGAPEVYLVEGLAPFAVGVRVDGGGAVVLPMRLVLPEHMLRPSVGSKVQIGLEKAEVMAVRGDVLELRSLEVRTMSGAAPNPQQLRLPLWVVLAAAFVVYLSRRARAALVRSAPS